MGKNTFCDQSRVPELCPKTSLVIQNDWKSEQNRQETNETRNNSRKNLSNFPAFERIEDVSMRKGSTPFPPGGRRRGQTVLARVFCNTTLG